MLVVLCGWPLSGKTTIAKRLQERTEWHWIDIDDVRRLNFGLPNPYSSEEEMLQDKAEMAASYELLVKAIQLNLGMGNPIIVTATFSKERYWTRLSKILTGELAVKVVWCRPQNDSTAEIDRRLKAREFGTTCFSTVNSVERYHTEKSRFEPPQLPSLEIDTSSHFTIDACVARVAEYLEPENEG